MSFYPPIFQPAKVIYYGFRSQGNAPPPSGTSVRYYPSLFQPARMIRFGFMPRGSSGAVTFSPFWAVNSNVLIQTGARSA